MNSKLPLMALVASMGLAACGGGPDATSNATRAAPSAHPLAAVRAQAAAGASAADQLMDFAEASFKQYFPTHQVTQSLPPFAYRCYAQTGVCLGVVVSSDPAYVTNGVYVLGGPFGSKPLYVGVVSDFITVARTDPGPGPGTASNGCVDLALYETEGTRIEVNYRISGADSGTVNQTIDVGGLTSFEGHQARAVTTTTRGSSAEGAVLDTSVSYVRRTGDAENTEYGYTDTMAITSGGNSVTISSRTVWSPPVIERFFGLAVGQSYTTTYSGTTTQTTRGMPGVSEAPETSTDTSTTTMRYVGRQTITVPAGTYQTCRFDSTYGSAAGSDSEWRIVGSGIVVKTISGTGSATTITEAASVTLNGQAL